FPAKESHRARGLGPPFFVCARPAWKDLPLRSRRPGPSRSAPSALSDREGRGNAWHPPPKRLRHRGPSEPCRFVRGWVSPPKKALPHNLVPPCEKSSPDLSGLRRWKIDRGFRRVFRNQRR